MTAPYPITPLQDYLSAVLRKSGTLYPAKLAAIESRVMWEVNPGPNWFNTAYQQAIRANIVRPERSIAVDHDARNQSVMDALPGTLREIAARTVLTLDTARKALHRLQNNGHVASRKAHHNVFVWEESQ